MKIFKRFLNQRGFRRLDSNSQLRGRNEIINIPENYGDTDLKIKMIPNLKQFENFNLDTKWIQNEKIFVILNYMATFANLRFLHFGDFEYQNELKLSNDIKSKLSIHVEYNFSFDNEGNRWDCYVFFLETLMECWIKNYVIKLFFHPMVILSMNLKFNLE